MTLGREEFFRGHKPSFVTIDVPEIGGRVNVMEWNGAERDAWEFAFSKWRTDVNGSDDDYSYYNAVLVAHVVCDADRRRLFTTTEDIRRLHEETKASALTRISRYAAKINGLGQMEIEEAAKNSGGGPNGSPGGTSEPS